MNVLQTIPAAALSALHKDELLHVAGRRGQCIASRRGTLWLTQDDDPNDVVLAAGQAHRLEADGPVLIQALEPACVAIEGVEGRPAGWWARLRAAWPVRDALGSAA